jgi:hypothetical protein
MRSSSCEPPGVLQYQLLNSLLGTHSHQQQLQQQQKRMQQQKRIQQQVQQKEQVQTQQQQQQKQKQQACNPSPAAVLLLKPPNMWSKVSAVCQH